MRFEVQVKHNAKSSGGPRLFVSSCAVASVPDTAAGAGGGGGAHCDR